MREIFKKVLLSICIYLVLMIAVSGSTYLFSSQDLSSLHNEIKLVQEINQQEKNTQLDEQIVVNVESAMIPFSFDVDITKEEQATTRELTFIYFQVLSSDYLDVLAELEKRKANFKYKRKFALYTVKQKIKHLKTKVWKIKEGQLCL